MMMKSLFNETLNGFLYVLAFYVSCVFIWYIWVNRRQSREFLQPAFAIGITVVGECVVRGVYWYVRHQINDDVQIDPSWFYVGASIGGIIEGVGLLMIAGNFSPEKCGPKSWITAITLAFVWTVGWLAVGYYF